MSDLATELGGTLRAAMAGWAATVRLVVVLIVITICYAMVAGAR
jgi:hypothetical protein